MIIIYLFLTSKSWRIIIQKPFKNKYKKILLISSVKDKQIFIFYFLYFIYFNEKIQNCSLDLIVWFCCFCWLYEIFHENIWKKKKKHKLILKFWPYDIEKPMIKPILFLFLRIFIFLFQNILYWNLSSILRFIWLFWKLNTFLTIE